MCLSKSMMFNRVYSDAKLLLLRGEPMSLCTT
jgi:hypothetical protein